MGIWPIGGSPGTGMLPKVTQVSLPINSTKANLLFPASCKLKGAKASSNNSQEVLVTMEYTDKDGKTQEGEWGCRIPGLPQNDLINGASVSGDGKSITVSIYSPDNLETYEKSWQLVRD
jgi:hypothetical protein